MLHTQRGLKLTKVVEAVLDGLRRARETYGIKANVIVCGIRNISAESSYQMAELAVAYKGRGVVGFDLAGAEADFPAKHHRAAFQLVRDNNINCTIHAGEAYGPESIAQAIHVCGAHRIGHGCRLREDGDLLHYLNDHRVPLDAARIEQRADRRGEGPRLASDQAVFRPRFTRDGEYRQPADHGHQRVQGTLLGAHQDGRTVHRHQEHDHRWLQVELSAFSRETGSVAPR